MVFSFAGYTVPIFHSRNTRKKWVNMRKDSEGYRRSGKIVGKSSNKYIELQNSITRRVIRENTISVQRGLIDKQITHIADPAIQLTANGGSKLASTTKLR
jgi:hypothetical protein